MNKAFGDLVIKAVDEEKRTFKGIASTPNQDRAKDVLLPQGARFKLPMPLLFHHESKSVVGHVTGVEITNKGIEVDFHLPKVEEAGALKDRVEEAYQSLKYGLIKGLSVGFMPVWEKAEMIDGGGIMFGEWEWYELSLVTIPCNRESEADFSKAFKEHQAALGVESLKSDGVTSKTHVVHLCPTGGVKL